MPESRGIRTARTCTHGQHGERSVPLGSTRVGWLWFMASLGGIMAESYTQRLHQYVHSKISFYFNRLRAYWCTGEPTGAPARACFPFYINRLRVFF